MSRATDMFAITDTAAELYESTAHEIAFALSSASVQQGADAAHEILTAVVAGLIEEPATRLEAVLVALIERLLIFIRSLGKKSPHPLAENLRSHADLTSARAEQMLDGLSAWLAKQQGDPA